MRRRKRKPTPLLDAVEKYQVDLVCTLLILAFGTLLAVKLSSGKAVFTFSPEGARFYLSPEEARVSIVCVLFFGLIYGAATLIRIHAAYKGRN